MSESIQLQVQLGASGARAQELYTITRDLHTFHTVLASCTSLLAEANALAQKGGAGDSSSSVGVGGKLEREGIEFARRRRAAMEAHFISDDLFSEYTEGRNRILRDEGDAVARLAVFNLNGKEQLGRQTIYLELKKFYAFCAEREPVWRKAAAAVAQKNEEHLMSTKCVIQRFEVEEKAHDTMRKVLEEYMDFLYSLKLVEGEERMAALQRTRLRCQESLRLSMVHHSKLQNTPLGQVRPPAQSLTQPPPPYHPPYQQPANAAPYPPSTAAKSQPWASLAQQPHPPHGMPPPSTGAMLYGARPPNPRSGYNYPATQSQNTYGGHTYTAL